MSRDCGKDPGRFVDARNLFGVNGPYHPNKALRRRPPKKAIEILVNVPIR